MQMFDDLLGIFLLQRLGQKVVLRIRVLAQIKQETLRGKVVRCVQEPSIVCQQAVDRALVRRQKKLSSAICIQFLPGFGEEGTAEQRVGPNRPVPQQIVERGRNVGQGGKPVVVV